MATATRSSTAARSTSARPASVSTPRRFTPGSLNQIINTGTINVGAGGTGILVSNDGSVFNAGTINAADGAFAIDFCFCSPASSLTLAPTSVINGLVQGANTTFQLGGTGTGTFNLDLIGAGRQYDGFTTFNKIDASTWTLTGTGNQDWNVLGGTLAVNGTLTGTLTVNSGTVGGTGILGNTTINGGTLAPGNSIGTITINGNLVLAAAAAYAVEIGAVSADRTLVTGTASIAGTVQASFVAAPLQQRYTILTAGGGVNGVFGALNVVGMPGVSASLTYDPNNVYLNLTAVLGAAMNQNQQNVATSLNTVFNGGGSLLAALRRAVRAERSRSAQRADRIVRRDRDAERAGRVQLGRLLPQPDARSVRLRPRRRCRRRRAGREPVCS